MHKPVEMQQFTERRVGCATARLRASSASVLLYCALAMAGLSLAAAQQQQVQQSAAGAPTEAEAAAYVSPAQAMAAAAESSPEGEFSVEARLPPFQLEEQDAYMCTAVPLPKDRPLKLVGVDPLSRKEVVHHMLLFGERGQRARRQGGEAGTSCADVCIWDRPARPCPPLTRPTPPRPPPPVHPGCKTPASVDAVWNCKMRSACSGGTESVLYGWGKDAPPSRLPPGVGYSVGKGTAITTLVLQVCSGGWAGG